LSASFPYSGPATFSFSFSGSSSSYSVNVSTTSNMASDVYLNFVTGSSSPLSVSSPTSKWDKYSCGRVLYWRVTSSTGIQSSIQSATVGCPTGTFSNLSASFPYSGPATFSFSFSGSSSSYSVNVSTTSNMASDVYLNFATGSYSPLSVSNPASKWDKYSCGRVLYWRVTSSTGIQSSIQSATVGCPTGTFSSLSASFPGNGPATFSFSFSGSSSSYSVSMSTTSNMASDVYLNFATGSSSPLSVSSPASKWDKYSCGRVLYWRVTSSTGIQSPIQSATVSCSFSSLSASLPGAGPASFSFAFNGPSSSYTINISTSSTMATDVYNAFGTGTGSPVTVSSPMTRWDKYTCGRTLYWRVVSSSGVQSSISSATVNCPAGTFSNLSASLPGNGPATFSFSYSSVASSYTVSMSTTSDMSTDVHTSFASGTASPLSVSSPASKWDKYICGRTLYWRVSTSTGVQSPIQSATVSCSFSNLSASLTGTASFSFSFNGPSSGYTINISTSSTMATDVYNAFGTGNGSPVTVSDPMKWDKYTCGRTLYWRVVSSSGVQSSIVPAAPISCAFSGLSASLPGAGPASFTFSFSGPSSGYTIDISITPGMTSDVRASFGTGTTSPVLVTNPSGKWNKYTCGRPVYWRVTSSSGIQSSIRSDTVTCGSGTFSDLSATLLSTGPATFHFTYSGTSTEYTINLSTTADMGSDVSLGFGSGTTPPVIVTNPLKWNKYVCGETLYWRVIASTGDQSPIQSTIVSCGTGVFSSLSAELPSTGPATFAFTFGGSAASYTVDLSTDSNMSTDVHNDFATGSASPLTEATPTKWDKYVCGQTLYWRVTASTRDQSSIQSATVTCTTAPVFSDLSATLPYAGQATFHFTYSGTSTNYTVDLSTTWNFSTDINSNFGSSSSTTVVVPNPTQWDKYTCGRTLYWRVTSSANIQSEPQAAYVSCQTPGKVTTTFNRKVLVLTFNPYLPSRSKTLIEEKTYAQPADLAQQYIQFLKSASHGRLSYSVTSTLEINDTIWFTKADGTNFVYNETTYLDALEGRAIPHGSLEDQKTHPTHQDYNKYEEFMEDPEYDLCGKANRGEIDEVWIFSGPWFGFYESRLAGPGGFYYNSAAYPGGTCNQLLPIMGFSYETGYGNGIEAFIHRFESTMDHVYGGRNRQTPVTNWDRFTLNPHEAPALAYSGCGWAHYPPNAASDEYDWVNPGTKDSICDDFYAYPNLGDPLTVKKPVSCTAWGCSQLGFFDYWLDHIPTFEFMNPDGKPNDWWPYLADPNLAK
jgi:hypothetical protein